MFTHSGMLSGGKQRLVDGKHWPRFVVVNLGAKTFSWGKESSASLPSLAITGRQEWAQLTAECLPAIEAAEGRQGSASLDIGKPSSAQKVVPCQLDACSQSQGVGQQSSSQHHVTWYWQQNNNIVVWVIVLLTSVDEIAVQEMIAFDLSPFEVLYCRLWQQQYV